MRFPRMHIAASVQNRILNAAEGIMPPAAFSLPPQIAKPDDLGAAIDQAVQTPVQAAAAPVDSEEAILAGAVSGDSAADAVGGLAAIEAL